MSEICVCSSDSEAFHSGLDGFEPPIPGKLSIICNKHVVAAIANTKNMNGLRPY